MKRRANTFVFPLIVAALTVGVAQAEPVTVYFELTIDSIEYDGMNWFSDQSIVEGDRYRGHYVYDTTATNIDNLSNADFWDCSSFATDLPLPGNFEACQIEILVNYDDTEYYEFRVLRLLEEPSDLAASYHIFLRFSGDFGYDDLDLGVGYGHVIVPPPADLIGTPMTGPFLLSSRELPSSEFSFANVTATLFLTYPASWVHEDLYDAVVDLGPGNSLADKIAIVEAYLEASDEVAACAMLADFQNQVKAQKGKKIAAELAEQLLADAQEVMDAIPCQ